LNKVANGTATSSDMQTMQTQLQQAMQANNLTGMTTSSSIQGGHHHHHHHGNSQFTNEVASSAMNAQNSTATGTSLTSGTTQGVTQAAVNAYNTQAYFGGSMSSTS
jgi:hypothetical protein